MEENIEICYYSSPVGELILGTHKDEVIMADWRYRQKRKQVDTRIQNFINAEIRVSENKLHEEMKRQFNAYFKKELFEFDLPIRMIGTSFQKDVWNELMRIPYGKSLSYLELSNKLGNQKAIRAVASANGANAISVIVPCHRIIGKGGALVGYAGGLNTKKRLLTLEGALGQIQLEF